MSIFKKATLATVLGATALSAASPAMAQGYYYGHRSGGDSTGAAIAGGIIGLALGAIVASSVNNHHDRYAERGWTWRDGYYWDRDGRRYYRDGRPCEDERRARCVEGVETGVDFLFVEGSHLAEGGVGVAGQVLQQHGRVLLLRLGCTGPEAEHRHGEDEDHDEPVHVLLIIDS